jgi:hypothetical protein
MDDRPQPRGVTAQEFFAARIEGGSMTEAHRSTGIAYSTVFRAAKGDGVNVKTAKALEQWSRGVGGALFISASATLGVSPVALEHDATSAPDTAVA